MKSLPRWTGLLTLLALLQLPALAEERILARAKDFKVTQEDLDSSFIVYRATLAAQGRDLAEQMRPTIERQLVEKMALTRVLVARANETDRKTAKEKTDKMLTAEKERSKSQARYEAQVRALGMAPDDFEKQLLERAICEQVLERELRPTLGVTPERVRAFYDENLGRFKQPDRIRLCQVVLSLKSPAGNDLGDSERTEKKALAQRIVDRARKGEELEALARQYSDDAAGRERGGEYLFPIGRMIPEFESAVTSLETNKVSEVIATPNALHVVKVLSRVPSEQVPFEQVEPQIRAAIELEETNKVLPDYQKRLFTEVGVVFTMPEPKQR
jgi:peptidyl-prolyl cis-trans isomerase C